MTSILARAGLRYLARHPWQSALAVMGIALGVAVVVAVDLANQSARRAFSLSMEGVAGRATHQIVGGPAGLPEAIYRRLRVDLGIRDSAPVVEGYVTAYPSIGAAQDSTQGRVLTLLGVDPFAEAPFRVGLSAASAGRGVLSALLTQPGSVILSEDTAQRLALRPGDGFSIKVGPAIERVTLVAVLHPGDERTRRAMDGLLLADVATAQELLDSIGRLSRIDLIIPEGEAGERELGRIRSVLPAGAEVMAAAARSEALGQMTTAFNHNLTALSLLALIVGMFLIYNTMSFMVVQRREMIGVLRALGVTRREVFRQVLGEALLIGLLGTGIGLALGIGLAGGLLRLVTRTINDLYFVLTVSEVTVTPASLAKGLLLGLMGTLLAGLAPAHEAATAPPRVVISRSLIEARALRTAPRAAFAGAALLAAGAVLLLLPSRSLLLAYAALLGIILGFALLTPAATVALMHALRPLLLRPFGILGRLAVRGVVAGLSRTGVAVAALAVAISATIGVAIMIESFRDTVAHWLAHTLRADLYVSLPVSSADDRQTLDSALVERLSQAPGVASYSTSRIIEIESASGITRLLVLQIGPPGYRAFRFKHGDAQAAWPAFQMGGAVLLSESYAYRHGLDVGDRVRLRTDRGEHAFPVVGVYYSYATDQGLVVMSRSTYQRFWDDRGVSSMGIYAAPGTDLDRLRDALLGLAGGEIQIKSNRAILDLSLKIFDRTFAVTEVLRALSALVAFLGVLSALMALQLERTREIGVLRAMGLTPAQVWGLVSAQTGLMGLVAGLLAIPLGLVMALVLVLVINRRSFGWTLEMQISAGPMLQGLLLALAAALLAGLYPAIKMARASTAEALRGE